MARRATYFNSVRNSSDGDTSLLFLAGPYEFYRGKGRVTTPEKLEILVNAFQSLNYDLGYLSDEEHEQLEIAGLTLPDAWIKPDGVEHRILTLESGAKVAVVMFPALGSKDKMPSKKIVDSIRRTTLRLRDEADLIIGLSPWGLMAEKAFLEADPTCPDLIFGGGPGLELEGSPMVAGKTFWIRTYIKGQTVNRIDIYEWPSKDGEFTWTDNGNITTKTASLSEQFKEDPEMLEILGIDE